MWIMKTLGNAEIKLRSCSKHSCSHPVQFNHICIVVLTIAFVVKQLYRHKDVNLNRFIISKLDVTMARTV